MWLLRVCFIAYVYVYSVVALAAYQNNVDDYKQRLEQLQGDDTDPANKAQRELYQQIVNAYQEAAQQEEKAHQLRNQLERQPAESDRLNQQLQAEGKVKDQAHWADFSLTQLEQQLPLKRARVLALEQTQERLRKEIAQSDQRLMSLREQLVQLKQKEVDPEQKNSELYDARFARRAARIQALELEVLALPGQNDLNRLRLQLTNRELSRENNEITQLQDLIQSKRRDDAEATLQTLQSDEVPAKSDASSPAITQLQQQNQTLSQQLRNILADGQQALELRRKLEEQLQLVSQSHEAVQQQLALSNQPLGDELRKFTRRLSKPINTAQTQQQLNRLRLLNLEIARDQFSPGAIPSSNDPLTDPELAEQINQLHRDQMTLQTRIRDASNQTIYELSQLLSIQEQINKQVKQGKQLITRHLLWIPSVLPVSGQWFSEIVQGVAPLYELLRPQTPGSLLRPQQDWLPRLISLLMLGLMALLIGRYYRRHGPRWKSQIGNVVHDSFRHTFRMLWMPVLITLPLPGTVLLLTHALLNGDAWAHEALPAIGLWSALALWLYTSVQLWLNPRYGLLSQHFSVPEPLCKRLRQYLHWLFWLGVPLLILLLLIDQSDSMLLRSGIGRLVFIALAALVALFWTALWKEAPQIDQVTRSKSWWQRARLWLAALVAIHLLVIIAALLGYVLSGAMIMGLVLTLCGIFCLTFIIFKLGNRWLLIEERHFAFDRAKARRNEILAAREKNEEVPPLEENYIDLQTISDQARVLLKAGTVLVFLTLLWLLLKNALPTLDILDEVVLWSHDVTTSDGIISESITLKNILLSVGVIVGCVLAAYNLPGLLELLVLRHIQLTPGTSYAITTISKYILIVFSVMAGASQLGLEWAKLQWLVAALGVGLGFGLQEIVANFVSGLIILFEKPIRIGDTVTLGSYTGTVTRIQIRATTISDWDRREVIIPNKNFVTDQLINWSLTDPVTRVVVPVGVAYGSDTALARELLLEVAKVHEKVLQDPEPNAFFIGFGASTLDMELRFFVSSMADRLVVTHDINQAIDAAFKAHQIEIAFPQLDVHLRQPPSPPSPQT